LPDDLSAKIAEAEAVLAAGVTSSTSDGVSTTFDLDHVARNLRSMKRKYWAQRGHRKSGTISQPYRFGGCG